MLQVKHCHHVYTAQFGDTYEVCDIRIKSPIYVALTWFVIQGTIKSYF